MNLQTELALQNKSGLLLHNPVMTAVFTFEYDVEYAKIAEINRFGLVICKGTTLRAYRDKLHPYKLKISSG